MDHEKVLGEHKFPTYEELKTGLIQLIDEGKISREDAARLIPELRESEDERIRKMCIAAVNIAASADGGLLHSEASECLAWLEEQKDKNCLACDQYLKGYIAGRKVTEEEKQKEPENTSASTIIPSCWEVEQKESLRDFIDDFPYSDEQKEQKPMKWSEEDEKIRKQLINICNEWLGGGYSARPCLNDIRWLKNLLEKQKEPKHAPDDLQKSFEAGQTSIVDNPEQYGLCKKAEWSEEDDRVFEFAIARVEIYERDFLHGNNEMSERLKALHPRPSWKPSEEQMKVLLNAEGLVRANNYNENAKILASLYEQLKKL